MEHISYDIIGELLKGDRHIRDLAKRLGRNHMTVLRKIRLLEEENVVDFRQEGRNNVYFVKKSIEAEQYIIMAEHCKLVRLIGKHPRLRRIVEGIQHSGAELAIVFGSYAKGLETDRSDIDIYIYDAGKNIKDEVEMLDSKLSIKTGGFSMGSLLIREIVKDHVIIKGTERYYELVRKETGKGREDKTHGAER